MNCSRLELHLRGGGERFQRQRLGQTRHAFEQQMAVADQSDQQSIDQVLLTDDHAADLLLERSHPARRLGHRFVDGLDADVATGVLRAR